MRRKYEMGSFSYRSLISSLSLLCPAQRWVPPHLHRQLLGLLSHPIPTFALEPSVTIPARHAPEGTGRVLSSPRSPHLEEPDPFPLLPEATPPVHWGGEQTRVSDFSWQPLAPPLVTPVSLSKASEEWLPLLGGRRPSAALCK